MKPKNIYLVLLLGLSGPILLIFSEFFSWFSDYNLIELYVIVTDSQIEDSFLFLFPIISGVICLIANGLVIFNSEYRIKSIILSFVGIGFQLLFFIDHITQEIEFISDARIGLYLGIFGFLLILINLIYVLTTLENPSGG
ncbi:MAG: hypothetical protein KGD58_09730 [Candidatus Lokiarchaeota archaeon]|nr:hypothetical protein [Candidatus Lokiarchaeota archaeon]